jgi:hypothetical protein
MSGTMISALAAIAVRVETTQGVDVIAGSPAAGDQVWGSVTARMNTATVDDPSITGSLDRMPAMIAGTRPTIEMSIPMRGSGAGGTAPAWGAVLRACGMTQTVEATGVAATAATAGTATTATLAAAFSNTAQAYRGVAAILTGNPTGPLPSAIINYTTGRVATFAESFSPALSASTLVQIPPHVVYRPTSDLASMATVTVYVYQGGYRWRFVGGRGTARIEMPANGIPMLMVTLQATLLDQAAAAIPAALSAAPTLQPPPFLNGRSRVLNRLARVSQATSDLGNEVILPPNPEAVEGVDTAVIVSRQPTFSFDPTVDTTAQATLWSDFRAGTTGPLQFIAGTTAGNRICISSAAVRAVEMEVTDRQGIGANSMRAQAASADAGFFVCHF